MGFIVNAVVAVVKTTAELVEDSVQAAIKAGTVVVGLTVKVGGVVLKAASPVTKIAAGAIKFTLDNSLGRVLPVSIYGKISSFTNAQAAILEGNLSTKNFRDVVKGFVDIGLIGVRISKEATGALAETGLGKSLDKYTGGLLTSVHNLERVVITMENNGLTDNYEKINWKATLIDAIKVGAAVASGGTAVGIMTASNAVGDATGLDKTSLGAGVLTAGAMMATGTASFSSVASRGATTIGTKAVLNNTALGDSQFLRTATTLGITATVNSIQANTAFSDEMRNLAEAKAKEIATKEANEQIVKTTGLPLNVKMLESAYDFANSDKTIEQVLSEAQEKYTKKYTQLMAQIEKTSVSAVVDKAVSTAQGQANVLIAKAEALTVEKVQALATAEADKYVLDQLEKAKQKYGQKLFDYLVGKYGPKMDYADVATPDDYLNYQIYTPQPNKRIINVVYKNNGNKLLLAGAGIVAVGSYFAFVE